MRRTKLAWCTKCNQERPTFKDYIYDNNKKVSRYKVTKCVVCRERVFVASKYGAIRTKSKLTDRTFDSKKEARREPALVAMQNAGVICNLRYQVPYRLEVYSTQAVEELIATAHAVAPFIQGDERIMRDLIATATACARSRQTVATYRADFVYSDSKGNEVVEDSKGYVTSTYRMKKKLMVACHNVEIVEPGDYGVERRARGAGVRGSHTGSRFRGGGP